MRNSNAKREINTTHDFLIDLKNKCPISILMEHTQLTPKDIRAAIAGDKNPEIFTRLFIFWCWLQSQEEKNSKLNDAITELEMSRAFDLSSRDHPTPAHYADKHGV